MSLDAAAWPPWDMILVILVVLFVLFPFLDRKGRGRLIRRICIVLMRVLGVRMSIKGRVPLPASADAE